jgi:acetyl esterase
MDNSFRPDQFKPGAVCDETRAINTALAQKLAGAIPPADMAAARASFARGDGPIPVTPKSPRAETMSINGQYGQEISLRVIAPPAPKGVFLHIHGGGWWAGTAEMRDGNLERIAEGAGLACVSIDYRLAPEHPYPAGPDDCEAAALWLIAHAKDRFGSTRLVIGGESAGAHLAVVTLLRLRDAGHGQAFCGANLIFGVYDLTLTPSARNAEATLVTNRLRIEAAVTAFLTADADRRHPDISPLYADLRGLPPALFTVGTLDPVLDDSLFLCARWIAAGNTAELAVYPGGVHGFTAFPGKLAAAANAKMDRFMAEATAHASQSRATE